MDSVEVGTQEWLAKRRGTIGGSEIAALFGLSPHTTKFQLWHQKKGNLPEPDLSDDERVLWGTILEPAVAVGVQRKKKWLVDKAGRYITHPTIAGMGASLDYVAERNDKEWGALEIKTVDRLQFMGWDDGEPPMHYQLQLQHQLACCPDFTWGAIAVLIGGNELRIFEYDRHAATIAKIEAAVIAFWQSIREGREPPIDWMADADTIKALHRDVDGEVRDFADSNRLPILCSAYKSAGADEAKAKAMKEAAHAEILSIIGPTGLATTKGWRIKSTIVAGGPVSYERAPYRRVTITEQKPKGDRNA